MKKITNLYFWTIITPLYFFTRLINLKIIPIFTDEAIYSFWAQVALHDPANRFISMEDGKQPLFIWIAAIFQKFIADPLVATRLVSTMAGFGSTIGIYLLSRELFDKKVAKIAAALYVVLPFSLLYDRMALFDSLLTLLGIYSLLFAIKIAKEPKLDLAIINGVILGLGKITKSSADFFLYLLPVSVLFFNFRKESLTPRFARWIFFSGLSVFLSVFIFNLLRVSPLFYLIGRKNLEFIRSPQEVMESPLLHFWGNFNSIKTWFIDYNGYLLMVFAIAAIVWGIYRFKKPVLILSAYIFVPFLAELFFNKVLYPRFALFYFPYVIILIAYMLTTLLDIKKSYSKLILAAIIISLIPPLISSYYLLTNPPRATIAKADKNQYLNDWPAGYGVKEIVAFLNEQSKKGDVYIGTEGTFGLLPYALQIYFYPNTNIKIVGFWPVREIPGQVLESAKVRKTYFVFNESQNLPDNGGNAHLKLLGKYQKGSGNSYMRLYEIIP